MASVKIVSLETMCKMILRNRRQAVALAGDPSVASGRDWTNAARKVNLNTVDSVNAYLRRAAR
jgi:hypothetical protein